MRFITPFLFLLAVAAPVLSVPTSHKQPENHWAQLLRAGRYTLLKRPFWITDGHVYPNHNTSARSDISFLPDRQIALDSNATHNVQRDFQLDKETSRTTIFPPKGDRSRFEFHVHNPPANVQISRVIVKCQEIIEFAWVSEVTVKVKVTFTGLGAPDVLARGGGTYFVSMSDKFDTVLPVAAAEAVRKRDINDKESGDGRYDVLITINTNTQWYDGVTGNPPPDRYDLVTVILHELYHNLVFAGSIVARVVRDPDAPGGTRQTASLHRNYRTRFDAFLANEDGCAVLSYLSDTKLSTTLRRSGNELLAAACTNNKLYFSYNEGTRVARLYAPRIFKSKSSVYHIDLTHNEVDSVMYPTVKRGTKQHEISTTILNIQAATINENLSGANRKCSHPLRDPYKGAGIDRETEDHYFDATPLPPPIGIREDDVNLVAGLPVWAFVLIILFAILLLLLLLGLCLCLLLRRKRKRSVSSKSFSSYSSRLYSRTKSSDSDVDSPSFVPYRPGHGGKASSSKKTSSKFSKESSRSRSSSSSRHTSSRRPTSTSSKPASKRTSSKTSKHTSSKSGTDGRRPAVCPSSGKSRYICGCVICCPGRTVTRPPPVASVHTFDPDSVPSCRVKMCKTTHKTCEQKAAKKICKTKTTISCHDGCHCVYCCRYKPSSHKPSKCSKSVARSSSRCEPKCETVCKTSTKCTTTSSSKQPSASSSRVPSTKPPSTKPPSRAPPSCKPPPTSKRCCKTSCYKCTNVVEINVGYNRC